MKAECWYCGNPQGIAKHGMIYLHQECFYEICDNNDNIEYCIKYAEGELPKYKENGDRIGYESFRNFLVSMQDFQKRWKNTTELIKKLCSPVVDKVGKHE
jgi:hypothetical protein